MLFNIFFEIDKKFSDKIKKIFSEEEFQKIFSEIQEFLPEDKKNIQFDKNFFEDKEINLFFVSDDEIKNLNKKFRNKKSATDCLSFENDEQNPFDQVFWEWFIAMPYIEKQAKEYWVSLKFEITKMIIHSVLHLYWYDHIENEDFEKMSKLEEKIMKSLKKEDFC